MDPTETPEIRPRNPVDEGSAGIFHAFRKALEAGDVAWECPGAECRVVDGDAARRNITGIARKLAEVPKYEATVPQTPGTWTMAMTAGMGVPPQSDIAMHFNYLRPGEEPVDYIFMVTEEDAENVRALFAWRAGQRWAMAPLILKIDHGRGEGFQYADLDGFSVTVADDVHFVLAIGQNVLWLGYGLTDIFLDEHDAPPVAMPFGPGYGPDGPISASTLYRAAASPPASPQSRPELGRPKLRLVSSNPHSPARPGGRR
jgi:hypothetical protein